MQHVPLDVWNFIILPLLPRSAHFILQFVSKAHRSLAKPFLAREKHFQRDLLHSLARSGDAALLRWLLDLLGWGLTLYGVLQLAGEGEQFDILL
jgi:hypothetical protein